MLPFKLHKTFGYFATLLLPQLFLGWLFYSAFNSPEGNTFHFTGLGTYWLCLIFLFLGLILLESKQKISNWILPCTIIFFYAIFLFWLYESDIFREIPRVKSSSINYEIIPLYLTVPGIFHAILDLIFKRFRPDGTLSSNLKSLGLSVFVPFVLYIFVTAIIPLFGHIEGKFYRLEIFITKIAICIAIAAFIFFFLRFILGNMIGKNLKTKYPIMVLLFGFLFPLIGLITNLNFEFFGDFNYPLVYCAFAINTIGLTLLLMDSTTSKFAGFLCASFGVPIVFYFFIIFLPFVPLSFIALIVFGAGILMLTPIVLFILQYQIMTKQLPILLKEYGKKKVIILSLACFFILPICFVGFCANHKSYLNELISETNQFDASDTTYTDYDTEKIQYIFKEMYKGNRRLSIENMQQRLPILSLFYDWYVFDNLQVSQQKTKEIQRLFLGNQTSIWSGYRPPERLNATLKYTYTTEYVAKGDFYKTQLHLAITNLSSKGLREFRSEFTLPKDVFISDYYLDIEDRRTFGILAEKKAANWIYEQITNQRRDPGILQYLYDDVISLKIFPFKKDETRTSGFTLYHRTPVNFSINNTPIAIDVKPLTQNITELSQNTFYIPSNFKENLPKVTAQVRYYFLVDNTTKGEAFRKQFDEDFSQLSVDVQQKANVLYVDADVNWGTQTAPKKSGFNFKKAIAQIQYAHRNQKSIPYVVVYAPLKNRYTGKYNTWKLDNIFPYDNLIEHSHWDKTIPSRMDLVEFSRNDQSVFLQNNEKPALISFDDTATLTSNFSGNPYLNALQLRLFHELNDLNPKRKKEHWLQALRESFSQNILTHSTTYISLETKAQETRLLQKQAEIMSADYAEKAGLETRRMTEPYFWVLLFFFVYLIRKQFLNQKTTSI